MTTQGPVPVDEIRSAMHLRTGQRTQVEALDAWLAQYHLEVIRCADVYDVCVRLLRNDNRIPALALLGADWLADDEFNIVPYMRQAWPRTGIVVYGAALNTPLFDVLPMVRTCRTHAAFNRLLAETPAAVVSQLVEQGLPHARPAPGPARPVPRLPERRGDAQAVPARSPAHVADSHSPAVKSGPSTWPRTGRPPSSGLTAEELAALLDTAD